MPDVLIGSLAAAVVEAVVAHGETAMPHLEEIRKIARRHGVTANTEAADVSVDLFNEHSREVRRKKLSTALRELKLLVEANDA